MYNSRQHSRVQTTLVFETVSAVGLYMYIHLIMPPTQECTFYDLHKKLSDILCMMMTRPKNFHYLKHKLSSWQVTVSQQVYNSYAFLGNLGIGFLSKHTLTRSKNRGCKIALHFKPQPNYPSFKWTSCTTPGLPLSLPHEQHLSLHNPLLHWSPSFRTALVSTNSCVAASCIAIHQIVVIVKILSTAALKPENLTFGHHFLR